MIEENKEKDKVELANPKNNKKFLWIIGAVVVIGLIIAGYFMFFSGNSGEKIKTSGEVMKVSYDYWPEIFGLILQMKRAGLRKLD